MKRLASGLFAACLLLGQIAHADDEKAPAEGERTQNATEQSRLKLQSTVVTGNRELPKVMSIVPWKKAQPGQIAGRPSNSLLNEIIAPIDREVFRRQLHYYAGLKQKKEAKEPASEGQ